MNIFITGAGRGIGLALTQLAIEEKSTVFALVRNLAKSDALVSLQKKNPQQLQILSGDVTDPQLPQMLKDFLGASTSLDCLINNAGILQRTDTREDFLESFRVNAIAPFHITQALLPHLRRSSAPRVAHLTSAMGSIAENSSGGSVAYRASKAALNMIHKNIALANPWLISIALHPGWVQTEMGGSSAPVAPLESARSLWKMILNAEANSTGRFYDFRGREIPW